MKIKRRDFLKKITAGSLLLAADPLPAVASREKPRLPQALGILYDATLCVGCQTCMVACKKVNDMPYEHTDDQKTWDNPSDLSSKTLNIIKRYSHGNKKAKDHENNGFSFIKRHCMHCVDPACVFSCPVRALTKDAKTGVVSYNENVCIGCRYCQISCPFNVPKFEWDSPFPKIVKCQLCQHFIKKGEISACCSACPTGASLFGRVEDLMMEAKRRQKMTPGKYYNFPLSSFSSGTTQAHKAKKYNSDIYGLSEIGGSQVLIMAGVSFKKLGLPDLPDKSFVSMADGIQYAIYKGMVYPVVVLGALIYMIRNKKDE
jgi:Fe-S-cluster-containing dehydrogenase component